MPDSPPPETFEQFPRRELRIQHSRRQFISLLALEMQVAEGRAAAGAAYKLSKLGTLADEHLAQVRPRIIPGTIVTVRDGVVYGQPPELAEARPLFTNHRATVAAFNEMNGRKSLAEVADGLAALTGWPRPVAFAYTRGLFLHLVEKCVCAPQ
jgi:hypothetical protein